MSRKETVWGARHISEEVEIKRILEYYEKQFNISLTKLEASAVLAERSRNIFWSDKEAIEFVRRLRGL
ncbi:MAG: hypothetical protein ACFFHD_05640 [Promethearchaeota archaeon]